MTIAYVLINTKLGQGSQAEKELLEMDEVNEVYAVYGVYDYIVKLETETMDELKNIITTKIRQINYVLSSLTLITVE
jgi:DNA-binding Lrp family transcriptional regulator